MPENKYDDAAFFQKYAQMIRSKKGLAGAGEWETLQALLPAFTGKHVLDLGCGYGWHCIYAAEQGAASVVGVDLSEKMLAVAREKTAHPQVSYLRQAIEDIDFTAERFDIVVSSLALHYIPSFSEVVRRVRHCLRPGGSFIFSVEHPLFTAEGSQEWHRDESGNIQHFPVDNYFFESVRETRFLGTTVTKYHRTLTTYLDGLLCNGFELQRVVEPQPPQHMLALEGMRDELRRPMMLIVSARKKQ